MERRGRRSEIQKERDYDIIFHQMRVLDNKTDISP